MLPEDKLVTDDMGNIDAYLLEVRSFGGMSGAPVFVRETVSVPVPTEYEILNQLTPWTHMSGVGRMWLLGLMHGHWEISPTQINRIAATHGKQDAKINQGIAIVVPAYQIEETLNHPDTVAEREHQLAEHRAGRPSRIVADAATPAEPELTKQDFLTALEKVSRPVKPSPPDSGR
jgi:hypothetical protein